MKKQLTLKLIESNDTPKIDNIVKHPEDGLGIVNDLNFKDKVVTILFSNLRQLQTDRFKVIKPILISDEEIKVGDSFLYIGKDNINKSWLKNSINKCINVKKFDATDIEVFDDRGDGEYTFGCQAFEAKRIEVTSEQISSTIKQFIVDGLLKDGDKVEVEYNEEWIPFDTDSLGSIRSYLKTSLVLDTEGYAIITLPSKPILKPNLLMQDTVDFGHSILEQPKLYTEEEVKELLEDLCTDLGELDAAKQVEEWFEKNKK